MLYSASGTTLMGSATIDFLESNGTGVIQGADRAMKATEVDTLHTLPLRNMPLETEALRRARLVKNSRLESMIELFESHATGSGQLPPAKLHNFFDLTDDRAQDFDIICRLGELPSFDVYSLRLSLRRCGIDIATLEDLKLSDAKVAELSTYMNEFTRPLIRYVYGDDNAAPDSLAEMMMLFADPDASTARENLRAMASHLEVDLMRIPKFLEDYADVYMSLTFYRQCLEMIAPALSEVLTTLRTIRKTRSFSRNHGLISDCILIERILNRLYNDVVGVLEDFRKRTENMWENMSANYYRKMESMVIEQQSRIGKILCALTVKLAAWNAEFPVPSDGQLSAKAAFLVAEMKYGLENLQPHEQRVPAAPQPAQYRMAAAVN